MLLIQLFLAGDIGLLRGQRSYVIVANFDIPQYVFHKNHLLLIYVLFSDSSLCLYPYLVVLYCGSSFFVLFLMLICYSSERLPRIC